MSNSESSPTSTAQTMADVRQPVPSSRGAPSSGAPELDASAIVSRLRILERDWHLRSLLPVLLLHALAFGLLYYGARSLLINEILAGRRETAEAILDAGTALVHDIRSHGDASQHLSESLNRLRGSGLVVIRPIGKDPNAERTWLFDDEANRLVVRRRLDGTPACRSCHGPRQTIATLELSLEVSTPIAAAEASIQKVAAIIGGLWLVFGFGMFLLRERIIGGPLARIRHDLAAFVREPSTLGERDLDGLAGQVHGAVESVIRRERLQKGQMARAEQLAALGAIAAGLSHEIKNPLAGIRAAVEVLRKEAPGPSKEFVPIYNQILTELDRVTSTVGDLLRLARPRAPTRIPVHAEALVRQAVALFVHQLRARGSRLEIDVEESLPLIDLDSNQIVQVLVNLLGNAASAVPPGGKVCVACRLSDDEEAIEIRVEDDGPGISPENLERIFEPFFTTKPGGTGLGLPISKNIVEQHGGSLDIVSTTGVGTTACVRLPFLMAAAKGGELDGHDSSC